MADTPSRAGVTGSYVQTYAFGSPMFGSATGTGPAWFGPSLPMAPTAPPTVAGRQYDYPVGYNLNTQPRAYEPITFSTLRGLADGYDLLRTVIETRKDQLARISWSIKSRDSEAKDKNDPRIKAVTTFFQRPDGVHGWQDWIRPVLEDLFVIDAPSLYMQRDRAGRLLQLLQLDGATIKPVLDDWGRTPQPYKDGSAIVYPPAYQQVLKSFPAVNYSTRDLIYRPRNRRVHKPYGYSPVEQIITTVNIALRRQLTTLEYFTAGNMPDSLIGVPDTWTPDQIVTFQKNWDAMHSGDLAARRRSKFVPGGIAKTFVQTRDPELKNDFDEWLARLICFAFSISPQALTKQMNRASADTQKQIAEEEGLEPYLLWLKALIDDVITIEFGMADLEFAWDNDDEVDQAQQLTVLTGYVSKAIMTINESRDRLGLDPLSDQEASQGMIITASGAVPLGQYQQQQEQTQQGAQLLAEARAKQEQNPQAAGGPKDSRSPQRVQVERKPAGDAGDDVTKFNANHDERGRFADAGAGGSTDQDHKDWTTAKEAAYSIAKGVAIAAAGALAVGLAPEALVAGGSAASIAAFVNYQADAMFIEVGMKSGKVILRHLGVDTDQIEDKLKAALGVEKAAAASADAQLKAALVAVADHARDTLVSDLRSRHAGSKNLVPVCDAIDASCERFKERLGDVDKVTKRKTFSGYRRPEPIPFDRPATRRAESSIAGHLTKAFAQLARRAGDAVKARVGKIAKADDPESPDDRARIIADEIASEFDMSLLQDTADPIADDLEDVASDSVSQSVAQIGPDDASGLIDQVNPGAVAAARSRAAEMVGMKWNDDGALVPSTSAYMAITDTTRDALRQTIADGLANNIGTDALVDEIEQGYGFSAERAQLIAATEVSRANSEAALASYQSASDLGIAVKKVWLVTTACCDICASNAAAGAIDLDAEFPSGDDTPPGHPHCRCALSPVIGETHDQGDE